MRIQESLDWKTTFNKLKVRFSLNIFWHSYERNQLVEQISLPTEYQYYLFRNEVILQYVFNYVFAFEKDSQYA